MLGSGQVLVSGIHILTFFQISPGIKSAVHLKSRVSHTTECYRHSVVLKEAINKESIILMDIRKYLTLPLLLLQ